MVTLQVSTSRFPSFISSAVSGLNALFNTTIISEEAAVGTTLAIIAIGTYYLSGSSNTNSFNCTTEDAQILNLWPNRFQSLIDTESGRFDEYNEKSMPTFQNPALSLDEMHDLLEKGRLAYLDLCRKRGPFKPLLAEFRKEMGDKEKPWIDCKIGEGEAAIQERCFQAFDALRNGWNDVYTARLYQEEDYFGSAISWITGKVWKESPSEMLKTIPQRILDAGLDGNDPYDALKILSFVRPIEKGDYCADGNSTIKKRHRETMLFAHPDRNPFPDAATEEEARRMANEVSQTVNAAMETLSKEETWKDLCQFYRKKRKTQEL